MSISVEGFKKELEKNKPRLQNLLHYIKTNIGEGRIPLGDLRGELMEGSPYSPLRTYELTKDGVVVDGHLALTKDNYLVLTPEQFVADVIGDSVDNFVRVYEELDRATKKLNIRIEEINTKVVE